MVNTFSMLATCDAFLGGEEICHDQPFVQSTINFQTQIIEHQTHIKNDDSILDQHKY